MRDGQTCLRIGTRDEIWYKEVILFGKGGEAFWDYTSRLINLLKPTGHVMHHHINIQQLYALPTLYLCVLYLSENKNSDLCHLQHKLIGFYNRDEKCLQRGTDWVFK